MHCFVNKSVTRKKIHHLTLSSVFWVRQKTWVADFSSDFQTMRFVSVFTDLLRRRYQNMKECDCARECVRVRVKKWERACARVCEEVRERVRENNIRNMLKISDYNCLLSLCLWLSLPPPPPLNPDPRPFLHPTVSQPHHVFGNFCCTNTCRRALGKHANFFMAEPKTTCRCYYVFLGSILYKTLLSLWIVERPIWLLHPAVWALKVERLQYRQKSLTTVPVSWKLKSVILP